MCMMVNIFSFSNRQLAPRENVMAAKTNACGVVIASLIKLFILLSYLAVLITNNCFILAFGTKQRQISSLGRVNNLNPRFALADRATYEPVFYDINHHPFAIFSFSIRFYLCLTFAIVFIIAKLCRIFLDIFKGVAISHPLVFTSYFAV